VRSVGFFSRAVRRGRRGGSGGDGQIHMAKRRRHIHTSEKKVGSGLCSRDRDREKCDLRWM
jgi:hypothetical protein